MYHRTLFYRHVNRFFPLKIADFKIIFWQIATAFKSFMLIRSNLWSTHSLLSEIYIYKISLKFEIIVDDHKLKAFIGFFQQTDNSNKNSLKISIRRITKSNFFPIKLWQTFQTKFTNCVIHMSQRPFLKKPVTWISHNPTWQAITSELTRLCKLLPLDLLQFGLNWDPRKRWDSVIYADLSIMHC